MLGGSRGIKWEARQNELCFVPLCCSVHERGCEMDTGFPSGARKFLKACWNNHHGVGTPWGAELALTPSAMLN